MDGNQIMNIVKKIRQECDTKSQEEHLNEYYDFFQQYSAIFFMARNKSMNLNTLEWMLKLKSDIESGTIDKEQTDKMIGQHFYDQYIGIKE